MCANFLCAPIVSHDRQKMPHSPTYRQSQEELHCFTVYFLTSDLKKLKGEVVIVDKFSDKCLLEDCRQDREL
ncbi:hypothetical protein K7X08_029725 [Anisodus acutangulus]|uniref:Uncharacterized protein n=1 Tax=Anisodus acutangulus TaxID=402998 RepID=A0A9Q1L3I6_9SOLA|nr:hypothetical protein K7X08_029725 [Anisodus acutangulus]